MKFAAVFFVYLLVLSNCAGNPAQNVDAKNAEGQTAGGKAESQPENSNANSNVANASKFNSTDSAESLTTQPKTVRDFFMLLPEKYFVAESCDRAADKDCRKAKAEYLKTFGEIDVQNGYLKGGCDGAQSCIEMAIFKRPDNTYIVGLGTFAEMMNDYHFLDYKNGVWTDISAAIVPEFSRKNMYEFPRYGRIVKVFAKDITEQTADYEISERGAKLYDLEWKDGKFERQK